MKVLLVATNRVKHPMPVVPLGACMVAEAAERAGHQVAFVDLMFSPVPITAVTEAVAREKPDCIALSVRNIDNNDMAAPLFYPVDLPPLLAAVKARSRAPIVLGGAGLSVMPEAFLRFTGATCAVTGDGEMNFPALLASLAADQPFTDLPGLCWLAGDGFHQNRPAAHDGAPSLCSVPDFSRWLDIRRYQRNFAAIPLQTKLGCHFRCIYCTYRKIEGSAYRLTEPASVVDAVQRLDHAGFRHVEFVDNVFNSPYDHAMALCEGMARAPISRRMRLHTLELNPLFVDDPLLGAMERAGFGGIGITVESASSTVLARLNKGYDADSVWQAARVVRRHNLPCLWIFLFGGPGETKETVEETLAFAEQAIRPTDAAFFAAGVRVYPGTALEQLARQEGVLTQPAAAMFRPVFYFSPQLDQQWFAARLENALRQNLHFMGGSTINLTLLPSINRLAAWCGIGPPLWRYTRPLRRVLRALGQEV